MNELSRPPPPRSLPNNPATSTRRTVGQVPSARPAGLPPAQPQQSAVTAASDSKKDVSHVPCKFYRSGGCTAGSSCIFAHVQPEAGQQKQPCQYFQKGSCKFGRKCALAHILPGQPMSMDRKNKKAAEAQAQALTERVASSLFASSPATLPPIPRVNSNGASSSLNPVPTKPKSPSKPNGLPPNPTTGASSALQEKETSEASSSKSSSTPAAVAAASSLPSPTTTKALPTTTKGFSFASLFPGSSASKLASTTAPSGLPPRPSAASTVPSSNSTAKEAKVESSLNPSPSLTAAASIPPTPAPPATASQPPASAPVASQPPSLPSPSAHTFPAPPPSHPPPPAVSFALGSSVRPPNGTAFPPVQRKDIVFGTTNRENSTTSPPSSSFSPTNQHFSSFPSPKPYSAIPTPIGPPYTRRTSHGPISPPASASSHSPHSFHPSPQHFHPTPTPLSPTRRLAPPLSSSSSYNAGPGVIGNGGGAAGGSPFSTSPFFAGPLGSRGLFLSSSYDNHVLDRTGSFTAGLPGGQPASMVDLDRGSEKWGGRGGREGDESGDEYSGRVGSRRVAEDDGQGESDDGEDFLPSSLNELLTDQEMERRMTRRGSNTGGSSMIAALPSQQQLPQYSSNQSGSGNHSLFAAPHLQQPLPPPIVDDPRAYSLDFTPLDRGHNSVPYSSTAMRPNLGMTPAMRSPWDDDEEVLGGAGSGRTVGRGRNTLRRPPVPFETNVASNGDAYPTEADGSFKIGPSHASVAFLPNFGERRYPPAPPPTDSFGHPPSSSSSNFFPPTTKNPSSLLSSSLLQRPITPTNHNPQLSNGFPSAFSNTNASSQQQQRWNLPLLSSSSSTANSNSISSFPNPQHQHQPSPQTQIGGFGQQQQQPQQQQYLHHTSASSTATLMAPLSPEELAASHEPGMSLPPGLGIGLGRTRIPFGVGVGVEQQNNHHFASSSNQQQQQQQGYPSSSGPWASSTTTTMTTNGGSGGRWITSVGAGGGVGWQAEEDVEDEMDDNVLFD